MTLLFGLIIFITILLIYFTIIIILQQIGILERYKINLYGPALLLRTLKGRKFLQKLAKAKKFWKSFGTFAVIFCFIMMILMVIILIWQAWAVLGFTPEQREAMPGPEIALVIPGINPILPLEYIGYIILALALAIVVHEFSHGILTYVADLKVKSLGILYMIIPIGAFCEPDEEALKKTKTSKRMRVYAAGPLSNFVVALLCILLFSFIFMSAVQPEANGLGVVDVYNDSPAYKAGIRPGTIITSFNGTDLTKYDDFNTRSNAYIYAMNKTNANDTVKISFVKNHKSYTKNITLANWYDYLVPGSKDAELMMGKGHAGVYSWVGISENLEILKNPLTTKFPRGFLIFYVIPLTGYFEGYNPIVSPYIESYEITGPLSLLPESVFWIIVNALYWIFWLNLAVGLFNVLPMIPLDGGFLFNDAIGSIVKKIKKDISDEKKQSIVSKISVVISLLILIAIIFPFFIKYI